MGRDPKLNRWTRELIMEELIEKLADPSLSPWPYRQDYCRFFDRNPSFIKRHLTRADLEEIETEALKIRRKCMRHITVEVDQALVDVALSGDVKGIKLYYERFDGLKKGHQVDFTSGDKSVKEILEEVFDIAKIPGQVPRHDDDDEDDE